MLLFLFLAAQFKGLDFQIIHQRNCVFFVIYGNIFFSGSLHRSVKSMLLQDEFF